MSDELSRRRSLDSVKKEAKRWLSALHANVDEARARLARAIHDVPDEPTLRDVQHALAVELGFAGWSALREKFSADAAVTTATLDQYEDKTDALLEAYRTGTPEAMERHWSLTWHRRAWRAMRTYVQLDLGKQAGDVDLTLDDAHHLIAIEHGFASWDALRQFVASMPTAGAIANKPIPVVTHDARGRERMIGSSREWGAVIRLLRQHPAAGLKAHDQMTDAVMRDVAQVEHLTSLHVEGSHLFTDDGMRLLARMPKLRALHVGGTAITDRGLEVLRELPDLETLSMTMTTVTDAGMKHLSHCEKLQRVELSWTNTGDAAIAALAGKENLAHLHTGNGVTDDGLGMLRALPAFARWRGGEPTMALLSHEASPNYLMLRGPFTDRGMRHLEGLDGLFALNLDASELAISAAALPPLIALPNLGWLAFDAKNDAMPFIARMPHLRFLGCQDTTADDEGFVALSRSRSIEQIWGRRCHNLRDRGFTALSTMPALRALSVSCLNVSDGALAALPDFSALRELMPMDIPDAGYRHIGQCTTLESLVLMYCRNTTDAATEHIAGLCNLSKYFASYTQITDRTPELLSAIASLERVTFDGCANLTNAGIASLARLPRLRELRLSGRGFTPDVADSFPPGVEVLLSP
ncbi:MAG: leucine-rich repeat cysteine-containing subtype [Gemmatimonadetes bacterium]|nr:leucine-rich repeat cysteine-containing subtype [Gemmatimonadota bacterium]